MRDAADALGRALFVLPSARIRRPWTRDALGALRSPMCGLRSLLQVGRGAETRGLPNTPLPNSALPFTIMCAEGLRCWTASK